MEAKKNRRSQLTPRTKGKLSNWKRSQKANLASMLVTQVQKGANKPQISPFVNPYSNTSKVSNIVLAKQMKKDVGKKTLVLDLDETLVHSSFQPSGSYDLLLPVEIEGQVWYVYVLKRPGVDEFLRKMAEIYELVIYTASLSKYADPLLDWLDPDGLWSYRLFREHCTFYNGIFVKDLGRLDRDLKDTIIIDNSPASYLMHPEWALPCTSWYDDMEDTELFMFVPILEALSKINDVRTIIKSIVFEDKVLFNKASQVLKGGKLGERSQSQKPTLRGGKQVSDDYQIGMNLSQQSGDLNEEDKNSNTNENSKNGNEPALSYFKSFQSSTRKSRTGSNLVSKNRGGSQRRSQHNDPDALHFMPKVESSKLHPSGKVNKMRNGWLSKLENKDSSSVNHLEMQSSSSKANLSKTKPNMVSLYVSYYALHYILSNRFNRTIFDFRFKD